MNIQAYSDNAKKHPERQVKMIAESIKRFGWQQPIVVDTQGIIIVGHGRYLAWQKHPEGMDEPWVVDNEGNTLSGKQGRELTRKEIQAYRLADNKLNESDWDLEMAIEELHSIDDPALQELTGFDMDLLLEPDEEDDVIPETPEEPRSKLGDLYELGGHRVLCGDSTKVEDLAKLMDGKKANMCFTDPPYNVNYGATMKDKLRGTDNRTILNDKMSDEAFDTFLFESMSRVLENTEGSCYIAMSSSEMGSLQDAFKNAGGHWSTFIVWAKNTFTMGRSDYQRQYEPILYGWREGVKNRFWCGDRNQSDIWNFDKPSKSELHPTMKPVELVVRAVTNSSELNGIVLDTFLGSGTTLIASEKTGRVCYGLELDPKFADVVVQRYVDYTGNTTIKCNGQDIVWEKTMSTTM